MDTSSWNNQQILFTSENTGQLWNTCVWDLSSGAVIHTFKGGSSGQKSLNLIQEDYLIISENGKPLLHYWPLTRKENKLTRIVLPGKPECVHVTRDGKYCLVAIGENLHIWQICSGRMIALLSRHFQPIKCIVSSTDSSLILTAGEDCTIMCWQLSSVVDQTRKKDAEPLWSWSNHSLPVTDMKVTHTGSKCRLVSVSLDQTCRIWDAWTGHELIVFMFNSALTSVCIDNSANMLYIGTSSGIIHQINIHQMGSTKERHITDEQSDNNYLLVGHDKEVTVMALSLDCTVLASGSKDMTVRLWHCSSRQCTRTIQHKGVITNIIISLLPACLTSDKFTPSTVVKQFDRHLMSSGQDSDGAIAVAGQMDLKQEIAADLKELSEFASSVLPYSQTDLDNIISGNTEGLNDKPSSQQEEINALRHQLAQALEVNKQLFEFQAQHVLKKQTKSPKGTKIK